MNEARGKQEENQEPGELESGQGVREDQRRSRSTVWAILRPLGHLGPGLLGGLSGNDSSAVTVYALDGAQAGFGHLWLLVLSTPLYQAVLYTCAKIGWVTQKGLAEILRDSYGPWVALPVCLALIVANIALISADLVAIGAGFNLLTGIDYRLFLIPAALLLW